MPKNPNPAKVLHLFADIQDHLQNRSFCHGLTQIARHTKDEEIISFYRDAAQCLEIEIDTSFHKLNPEQCTRSLKTLFNHLKWAKEQFDYIVTLKSDLNPKWIESTFESTEMQLDLSNYLTLLDREHDIHDNNNMVIKIGDLLAVKWGASH